MVQQLQRFSPKTRKIIFYLVIIVGIAALVAITIWLIFGAINSQDDRSSVAVLDGVSVREFAALPDDNAYPASVAVRPSDGMVFTGSYSSGAIWSIDADGSIAEIPGMRDAVGAVSGLTFAPDGTLYIVDQVDSDPRTGGGSVKRLNPDGTIETFVTAPDDNNFIAPDDVTLDSAGNVYVSDRGRDEIWRFDPAGNGSLWWSSPQEQGATEYAPTGLAYDLSNNTILVTDSSLNIIYRVSIDGATTETLYRYVGQDNQPVFDGITVTPDGTIYVAALAQDGVVRLDGTAITYIAGLFRGSSDVDYNPINGRLYVSNFDSGALVVPGLSPHLPFTIDEITLPG